MWFSFPYGSLSYHISLLLILCSGFYFFFVLFFLVLLLWPVSMFFGKDDIKMIHLLKIHWGDWQRWLLDSIAQVCHHFTCLWPPPPGMGTLVLTLFPFKLMWRFTWHVQIPSPYDFICIRRTSANFLEWMRKKSVSNCNRTVSCVGCPIFH